MRKIIIALLAATLLFSGTALAAEPTYRPEEAAALRSFLETTGADGQNNGSKLNPNWNPDDPATYGGVIWQDNDGDGVWQVRDIQLSGSALSGVLDVSGFNQLNSLSCLGTVAEGRNGISEVHVAGCTSLSAISLMQTGVTALNLDGLTNLRAAVLNHNQLTSLSTAGVDKLVALSLKGNAFVQTALPVFTYSNEKMYAPQNVLGEQQDDKTWTIGTSGSLSGLGAPDAAFTLYTDDGQAHPVPNPSKADLTPYKGHEIFIKAVKDGYTPLITNSALVVDGTFDYPAPPPEDNPEKPVNLSPEGSPPPSGTPSTGILPDALSLWLCLGLLVLLVGACAAGARLKRKAQG